MAKARRKVADREVDTRLHAESPAYNELDEWEVLAPQSMSVVLSVRLDVQSARELSRLAKRASQTPSGLLREWTLERLADSTTAAAAGAVREAQATYEPALGEYEALRDRYRPTKIKLLLLGESRPAGGTFFYRADSHLFFATREAWVRAYGSAPYGSDFLSQLQTAGVWLYDVAPAPVNRMPGRPRRDAVMARTADLVELLRATEPSRVVAIKRSLEGVARGAMVAAGLNLSLLRVLPFPLYQWREEYVSQLADEFTSLGRARSADVPSRRIAVTRRRQSSAAEAEERASPVTQPITPNDMSAGQVRIPQAAKVVLPDTKGPLTVVLRGERFEATYDPRNGPDRSRSGVVRIPRARLRELAHPHERLAIRVQDDLVTLD